MSKKTTTAKEALIEFVKEQFKGKNTVHFLISKRGSQRIEIKDDDTGEVWQTLEAVTDNDNKEDFDDISAAILSALVQQMPK